MGWRDSKRRRLLVADVEGKLVAIVKPSSGEVLATSSLPGRSAWAVYEPGSDRYLVNIRSADVVVGVDPESGQVLSSWKTSNAGPHGMDVDHRARQVLVACEDGHLLSLDPDSGTERGAVEIAGNPDAIWFNPVTNHIYLAIGNPGVLQTVNATDLAVIETIETSPGAHTLALDARRAKSSMCSARQPVRCSPTA